MKHIDYFMQNEFGDVADQQDALEEQPEIEAEDENEEEDEASVDPNMIIGKLIYPE